MSDWPWTVLEIERTEDRSLIRRAYAERLKAMDIDADIQGFSQLRQARDAALWEADRAAEDSNDAPLLADDDDWANLSVEDEGLAQAGYLEENGHDDEPDWTSGQDDFAIGWSDINDVGDNPYGYAEGRRFENQENLDHALTRLLYPDGKYSDEAFTIAEFEQAQLALDRLTQDAQSGDLEREQAIDGWLSEVLAESWPRSAPLLEQAAAVFDWLAQSGEIGEPPALRFLNPRLRGMRFTEKVERDDHPLHKAWVELKRPGARGFVDRLRVRYDDVRKLLDGIRARYPEVETYLDEERVASWEKPAPQWVSWIIKRLFVIILIIQAVRFCTAPFPDDSVDPSTPSVEAADQGMPMEAFLHEMLGPDASLKGMISTDTPLVARLGRIRELTQSGSDDTAIREGSFLIRYLIYRAVVQAEFEQLLAIHALRRDTARAVRTAKGEEACAEFLRSARLPDNFVLANELRQRERELGWGLIGSGAMNPAEDLTGPQNAPVPGWMFDDVVSRSGATDAQIQAEFAGEKGSRSCAIRLAMIDAMLARPGEVPADLLRLR